MEGKITNFFKNSAHSYLDDLASLLSENVLNLKADTWHNSPAFISKNVRVEFHSLEPFNNIFTTTFRTYKAQSLNTFYSFVHFKRF